RRQDQGVPLAVDHPVPAHLRPARRRPGGVHLAGRVQLLVERAVRPGRLGPGLDRHVLMAAKKKADKPAISPERLEEIRADARSGRNWASEHEYGPACVCGAFPQGATVTSWGRLLLK